MATPSGPPPGMDPRYIQQMMAAEAQRRGMTIEQLQAFNLQKIQEESARLGMSPQAFIQMKQKEAMEQHQKQQQQARQQGQPGAPQGQPQAGAGQPQSVQQQINLNQAIQAKPEALAIAKFLRSQNLKIRTCIFDGKRRDMFKVKRALRALQSPAYTKARSKNPLLPDTTTEAQAKSALQQLPVNMLALRVSKTDPHAGHDHAPPTKKEKRVKGLWTVTIEKHQDFEPLMHYMWLYEGPQWKTKMWAALVILVVFAGVLMPLWPPLMRQGVYYLSVAFMGLIGAFFVMAFFRLILFLITMFTHAPGLWLFPNLFEDVSFFDSFKPVWGWQETKAAKKGKKSKKGDVVSGKIGAKGEKNATSVEKDAATPTADVKSAGGQGKANGAAVSSGADVPAGAGGLAVTRRHEAPTVEEADDD